MSSTAEGPSYGTALLRSHPKHSKGSHMTVGQPRRNTLFDRPASRTPEEREAHFQEWKSKINTPYVQAGGKQWYANEDEQRALFFRRYQRPQAPEL